MDISHWIGNDDEVGMGWERHSAAVRIGVHPSAANHRQRWCM